MTKFNITEQQFNFSSIPIIEIEILKNGTINLLSIPVNTRDDIL